MLTPSFNTGGMTPAMRGRLERHLGRLVRADGEVMTYRALYTSGRYGGKRTSTHWVNGGRPTATYSLVYAHDDAWATDVPKIVFDAITLPDLTEES